MTDQLITEHAQRSEALAATFESTLEGSFGAYRIGMTRPDLSTQGGKLALQHIRLVREDGTSVVVGRANFSMKTAVLFTLGHTLALSRRRYGAELAVDAKEYLVFLARAVQVLEGMGLTVCMIAYERPLLEEPSAVTPERTRTRGAAAVAFAGIVASVAMVTCFVVAFAQL